MARVIAAALAFSAVGFAVHAAGAAPACNATAGDRAAIARDDSLRDFVTVRLRRAALLTDTAVALDAADRQAGRFAAFLAMTDPPAFRRMMHAVLDGCRFGDAVRTGYRVDADALWQEFTDGQRNQ